MTKVKICGITNEADATCAIESGADALGFILVPGSPRYVGDRPEALQAARRLPPFVTRVAVARTAEEIPAEWLDTVDVVQIYRAPAQPVSHRMVRVFQVRGPESLDEIEAALATENPHALMLDAYHKEMLGGSGQIFDWTVAAEARARFGLPVIMAGGLTPGNVAEAVRMARPYAVDVSSGVEQAPGRKDHSQVRAFIQAVRAADAALSVE
jgi:phosphoribosylanthranilate isomerase